MGPDIHCHLMSPDKCVKFQINNVHNVLEKALNAKIEPNFKVKKGAFMYIIIQSKFISDL